MFARALPLYTVESVRELDRRAIDSGVGSGYALMCRAGAAVLAELRARWPAARKITVVCGGGNNGGDGYVLARLALAAGYGVLVYAVGEVDKLEGDARTAAGAWQEAGGEIRKLEGELPVSCGVVVDAIVGTGLSRAPEGALGDAIKMINEAVAPVIAVDVPSGLSADTGMPLGQAVQADCTVTFIGRKVGMYTGRAVDYCGDISFYGLDLQDSVYAGVPVAALLDYEISSTHLPARRPSAHKGDHGRLLVVGGDHGYAGAVILAAQAALRSGAGSVTVATRFEHVAAVVAAQSELMCRGVDSAADLRACLETTDAVVVGPGLGRGTWGALLLGELLSRGLPMVVDADGLNLLAREPVSRDNWVLTPHPGEAGRMLHCAASDIQQNRFSAAGDLQERYGGAVILKGAGSVMTGTDRIFRVCGAGNPGMATAGTGDVLSGCIGGLVAQRFGINESARIGMVVHAQAGDLSARGGERGLIASDLLPALRRLLNP